jgi:hypothetical protein
MKTVLVLTLLFLPALLLAHRLFYRFFPQKKQLPAQGPAIQCILFILILSQLTQLTIDDFSLEKALFLLLFQGSIGAVYYAFFCVSESGRRFYLMDLIDSGKALDRGSLAKQFGKEHLLSVRVERLKQWHVIVEKESRYRLCKKSAYYYSLFFYLWGRFLGFKWFK